MKTKRRCGLFTVFVVLMMAIVVFAPCAGSEDSDAASEDYYTYTIKSGSTPSVTGMTPISEHGTNHGSWTWDEETGFGPFNSFYALFDASTGKMMGILNPMDLNKYMNGTDAPITTNNVMWVIPTVYAKTSSGNLVLSNDPSSGGTAYAHTIDGKVYKYLALGVYLSSKVNGKLMSVSGAEYSTANYADTISMSKSNPVDTGLALPWNYHMMQLYRWCATAAIATWDSESAICKIIWSYWTGTAGSANTVGPYGVAEDEWYDGYMGNVSKLFLESTFGGGEDTLVSDTWWYNNYLYVGQNSSPTADTANKTSVNPKLGVTSAMYTTYYGGGWSSTMNIWGMPTSTTGGYDYLNYPSSTDTGVLTQGHTLVDEDRQNSCGLNSFSWQSGSSAIASRLAFVFDADPVITSIVTYDHSNLTTIGTAIGDTNDLTSGLITSIEIDEPGVTTYTQLAPITRTVPGIGDITYTHTGWEVNNTTYNPTAVIPIDEDHTAKSIWTRTQIVTLDNSALTDLGGSTSGLSTRMLISNGATYPDLGEVSGFEHIGWYVDNQFYEPGTALVSTVDHTAYSTWKVPSITITFMVEGREHSTLEVPRGSTGVVYTPKEVSGVFMGWYYDASYTSKYDANTTLATDITLHAKGVMPLEFTSIPVAQATITNVDSSGLYYFDATDSDGCYKVHWDFGDGNTSDDRIAYNQYSEPGRYTVTLTVTNADGLVDVKTYAVDNGATDGSSEDGNGIAVYVLLIGIAIAGALAVRRAF